MRIAVVADAFPAVSETFVADQARRLAALGHEVVVVGDAPADPVAPPAGVHEVRHRRPIAAAVPGRVLGAVSAVARVGRPRVRLAGAVVAARRHSPLGLAVWAEPLVAAGPFDVVLSHFGWNARKAALVRPALGGASLVAVLHGADVSSWPGDDGPGHYAEVFERTDLLLPVSDRWRRQLLDWGAPAGKVEVHRMGIELDGPVAQGERPPGPLRVLSVARLVEKKGIEDAIRAVAAAGDGVAYDVVGEGPLRPRLERVIDELGARDRIRMLGARDPGEVARRLAAADVLLAPSVTAPDGDQEGIPVAIMEAMAAGLPVVSTHHSGIPELVEHEVTGLLVAEGDVEGLTAALRRLAADPGGARALGTAGRGVVADRHDADVLARRLSDRLEDLRGH